MFSKDSTIVIREAVSSDLEAIHDMQRALADAELPYWGFIDRCGLETAEKWGFPGYVDIKAKMNSDDNYVVVAEAGTRGPIVGISYGQIQDDDCWSTLDKFGYVGCVFVENEFRGDGYRVWPQMLAKLEGWFKERGIKQMRLECLDGNMRALKAYEKSEFRPMYQVMCKDI
jgi:hypothetical protein